MSWYRRFKNRKHCPSYEIDGKTIENLVLEYFPENELKYSCKKRNYVFDNTRMSVLRRSAFEFALDEIHSLFETISPVAGYYIELDYVRQELSWFRELMKDSDIIYTKEWFVTAGVKRPIYYFMKYQELYFKYFLSNWKDGDIFSVFPIDPVFPDTYFTSIDASKEVAGTEKRAKMFKNRGGYSKHRIFGHQFATLKNHKLEPMVHPRFKSRKGVEGKKYDI